MAPTDIEEGMRVGYDYSVPLICTCYTPTNCVCWGGGGILFSRCLSVRDILIFSIS